MLQFKKLFVFVCGVVLVPAADAKSDRCNSIVSELYAATVKDASTANSVRSKTKHSRSRPVLCLVEDEPQDVSDVYTNYLKACFLHSMGKANDAFRAYQNIIEQDLSLYAYDGFFHLLFDVGQFKTIVTLYEKKMELLEKNFQNNLDFQLIVAQAYLNVEQESKAEAMFSAITKKYPDNDQAAYYTALSLIQGKQLAKAHAFIDECLQKPILQSKHFLFYFLKSKLYLQENQSAKALAMINKSIKLFPRFDRGWLFKSILLEQQGKINDAITGYKKFLNLVGSEETIEKQLVQLLFSQKRYSEAAHYLKRMQSNRPEYNFDIALIEFKSENYEKSLKHIDMCLAVAPYFKQAKLLKIETLLAQKKLDKALDFTQKWVAQDPSDNLGVHTLILLRKAGISTQTLIQTIEPMIKNKKSAASIGLLSALADLCIENSDYKKGVSYYQSIYGLTASEDIKSKIIYHIAYILFASKNYANLDSFIPCALKFNPVSPNLYNLIAFYFADTDQKLDEALVYIDKALAIDKESPYYLDTKALILMKKGEKGDAAVLLKEAHQKDPDDETIKEHLALIDVAV